MHRSVLSSIPSDSRPEAHPVFLVGVAQNDLFWKDIRRVLFSQGRFTVFCRLAVDGLADKWNPVKMADVFSGIASDFDEMIQGLGDELMSGFKKRLHSANAGTTGDAPLSMLNDDTQQRELLVKSYAESIASFHERVLSPSVVETLIHEMSFPANWLDSVDAYRPVLADVTRKVDDSLGVETDPDVAHELRVQALRELGPGATLDLDGSTIGGNHPEPRCERFLDAEIVAIYW